MKENFVFIAGVLLMIVPFLGVPESLRQYSILIIGVILLLVGYALRRQVYLRRIDKGNGERGNDTYLETTETLFDEGALK